MLQVAEEFLERKIHPRVIVTAYNRALVDSEEYLKTMALKLDTTSEANILKIIRSTIGTKFVSRYGDLICKLAYKAVNTVLENDTDVKIDEKDPNWEHSNINIDIKRFIRIEKIPGGLIEESEVLDGILLNKDILHPKMKRRIENPRIICLDCPLEYNKGESHTNIEITKTGDFEEYLKMEEAYIQTICDQLAALKPDIIVTEKGCAGQFNSFSLLLLLRRLKKTDNVRLARACGAIIGHRVEMLKESDVGTGCGLFEVRSIADDYYSFFVKCKNPKACSVILRGGSKDVLQEMWRNLEDAMAVTKNILKCPKILPGGGATEMALSTYLLQKSLTIEGSQAYPYKAVAKALEVVPRHVSLHQKK
ncbi:CCT chaperonin gamma subunit [Reticulomyxa filosa]|uniref:CCT chaperonin gamma subunit n=1 Tax=Reticulomyxa filosa TaxID=46433 RepID=X6M9Y4_RETFI|nr:CCT chaperonin gamma subunit [Reticulomyxa filosa]|eukprot:ETO10446.1 CCT chaperonin gamma subunit [Reticulomyxa filosa]